MRVGRWDAPGAVDGLPEAGGQVAWLLGRIHVGERYVEAVREIARRAVGGWSSLPREQRREVVGGIVREHALNRGVYRDVMGGGVR